MAMPAHMTLTGEKQGKIDGSCELQGRENTIQLYEMKHDIHMPRNPHDGLPTGKRVHGPLSVVKMFDKSSPKLYQALCTGEHMKNVQIKWYRINKQGLEEHYFTTTLEDAIVVEMKPYMPMTLLPGNEPYGHMEEVSFSYKKIKWTWEPNGIEAEDSWVVPK